MGRNAVGSIGGLGTCATGVLGDAHIVEFTYVAITIGKPCNTIVGGSVEGGGVEFILVPGACFRHGHQRDEGIGVAGIGDDTGLDPAAVETGPEADVDGVADGFHLGADHKVVVLRGVGLQIHGIGAAGGVLGGVVTAAGLVVDRGVGAGMDGAVPAGIPGAIVGCIFKIDGVGECDCTAGGTESGADRR